MRRGHHLKAVSAGMLVICLLLAVPQPASAWELLPESHDPVVTADPQEELSFWERVWLKLSSAWARTSVLIDPTG